jgi:hypothetical protein
MVHESSHLCASITYSEAPDIYGNRNDTADECAAITIELKCGFHPSQNQRETGCFFL